MRFIFVHHEPFGPVNLRRLYHGEECFGGSVARLRLLFWLAERGHVVCLFGNVDDGEYRGVLGLAASSDSLDRLHPLLNHGPTLLVTNNPPDERLWTALSSLKSQSIRIAIWQGNPFPTRWLERLNAGQIDRIVCVSQTHRDYYRIYPRFRSIESSYSGVDTDFLRAVSVPRRSDNVVLSLSIPRPTKGIHRLLSAWPAVRRAIPDAILRICGSSKMHDPYAPVGKTGVLDVEIENQFPQLFGRHPDSTLRAGIELMGGRPLQEVYRDLKAAAVAVVNCNWHGSHETFCRSAVEAQFAGTPVVGAARGSLPEVVAHGKTGVLVNVADIKPIGDAIISLLANPATRLRMSVAGPGWAAPFADYAQISQDWEGIADRAFTGEPAPSIPRRVPDLLRNLGYGRVKLAAHPIRERFSQGFRRCA